jgi:hypothetical protein
MNKDAPDETESSGLSALAATSASLASVFVFNCSALLLTVLSVNNTNLAPQDIAGISGLGSPPGCLSISRNIFGSSALVSVTFEGFTKPSWTETIYINQLPMINMYLWRYLIWLPARRSIRNNQLYVWSIFCSSPWATT